MGTEPGAIRGSAAEVDSNRQQMRYHCEIPRALGQLGEEYMMLKTKVERLEQTLIPPPVQEPIVIIVRACDRPGPSSEEIETAKAEAKRQGNPVCFVGVRQ